MAFGPLTAFMPQKQDTQIESGFMPQDALSAPSNAEQLDRLRNKVAPDEEGSSLSLIKQAKDRLLAQSTGVDPLISWLAAYGSADPRNKLGDAAQAMTQAVGQQAASKQKLDLDVLQLDMAAADKRDAIAAKASEAEKDRIAKTEDMDAKLKVELKIAADKLDEISERNKKQDITDKERREDKEEASYWQRYTNRIRLYDQDGIWEEQPLDRKFGNEKPPEFKYVQITADNPLINNTTNKNKITLQAQQPNAQKAADLAMQNIIQLKDTANELKNHEGLYWATGFGGETTSKVMSGTRAANALALIKTLKSETSINALQAIRSASKTGGGLGNVSDKEGARLESLIASLDQAQSFDAYKLALDKLIKYSDEQYDSFKDSYEETYGRKVNEKGDSLWKYQRNTTKLPDGKPVATPGADKQEQYKGFSGTVVPDPK